MAHNDEWWRKSWFLIVFHNYGESIKFPNFVRMDICFQEYGIEDSDEQIEHQNVNDQQVGCHK
jgi:hypothetical protein